MIPRSTIGAVLLAALALAGLAGCAEGGGARSGATPKAMAACRQRADEVYERQNRGAVYRTDTFVASQRDAPFGGSGPAGNPSTGLSDRYAHDTILDDCLNGMASSTTTSGTPSPAAAAPVPAPTMRALPPPKP